MSDSNVFRSDPRAKHAGGLGDVRSYILDMVEQLALMAETNGDSELACVLRQARPQTFPGPMSLALN